MASPAILARVACCRRRAAFRGADRTLPPPEERIEVEWRTVKTCQLDRWVNENNIPEAYEYGKGWWDYIEWVREFAARAAPDQRVKPHKISRTKGRRALPFSVRRLTVMGDSEKPRFHSETKIPSSWRGRSGGHDWLL